MATELTDARSLIAAITSLRGQVYLSTFEHIRNSVFLIPSNITRLVRPFILIPAQIWIFTGCLGLQNVKVHNNTYVRSLVSYG